MSEHELDEFEPEPDEVEDETDEDEPDELVEAVEGEPDELSSFAVMEARGKEWERVTKYLAKNLGEIEGDDALQYVECPVCRSFGTPGFVLPQPPPPEVLPVLHQWLGMRGDDEYEQDPDTEACPVCKGLGEVLSGSKRPPNDKIPCARCTALGWIEKTPGARSRQAHQTNGSAAVAPSADPGSVPAPPADVALSAAALQAQREGFLVIPMTTTPAGG